MPMNFNISVSRAKNAPSHGNNNNNSNDNNTNNINKQATKVTHAAAATAAMGGLLLGAQQLASGRSSWRRRRRNIPLLLWSGFFQCRRSRRAHSDHLRNQTQVTLQSLESGANCALLLRPVLPRPSVPVAAGGGSRGSGSSILGARLLRSLSNSFITRHSHALADWLAGRAPSLGNPRMAVASATNKNEQTSSSSFSRGSSKQRASMPLADCEPVS